MQKKYSKYYQTDKTDIDSTVYMEDPDIPKGYIDISGLDKGDVFWILFEHAHSLGTDWVQAIDNGRSWKGDYFDPSLYDKDNGPGAAQAAIDELRESLKDIDDLDT